MSRWPPNLERRLTCRQVREQLSAALDGEAPGLLGREATHHLAGCGACREFEGRAASVTRQLRLRLLEPAPDLCDQILRRIALEPGAPDLSPASRRRRRLPARRTARWAAALVPLAIATSGFASSAFATTRVVPTRPVTACTAALHRR
jgi:predicted anti-sigma-YlaC factor YlaD